MIRLLLADDHPVVRTGLKALFSTESDIEVVAEASTGREAVELTMSSHPDIVLMDLQFGGDLQGAEATRLIRAAPDAPHVLVLTNYDSDVDILSAVEAGASGYLLKDSAPGELIQAVRAAATGESAISPPLAKRMVSRIRESALSPREMELLVLVAAGHSNQEIGRELFLSDATVKSHLVHIFTKLQVKSRTQAVVRARELGLLRQ